MNLDKNLKGRDFVVGDLHGCYKLFCAKLEEIKFHTAVDRMFSVGDLVDRGEDSLSCLKLMKKDWFFPVYGNHEDFLVRAVLEYTDLQNWIFNGGSWHIDVDQDELYELALVVKELPYSITIDNKVGIVHAQPASTKWYDSQNPTLYDKQNMIWGRSWLNTKKHFNVVEGIDRVYCGHTVLKKPKTLGNVNFIDTGAVFTGNLVVEELKY